MTKQNNPKNIYVRKLAKGKISVGEYRNARFYSVMKPFSITNSEDLQYLKNMVVDYEKRNKREILFVGYRGDQAAEELKQALAKI